MAKAMKREPEMGIRGNLGEAVGFLEKENETCGIRDHERARDAEHEGKSNKEMTNKMKKEY